MSGFNIAELLPFYLDETDEHIAALNDSLLRLEQDPTDLKALQEAFRMFHSIKGASVVMGFKPVNQLTHHLESLFEELRSKKRSLDRAILDLTFRCLDELRDYHRDLRAKGQSDVDLSGLVTQVIDYLHATTSTGDKTVTGAEPAQPREASPSLLPPVLTTAQTTPGSPATPVRFQDSGGMALVVIFQPNLPLADMKARLVINRLSTKARILSTDPPVERLDEIDPLTRFTVYLTADTNADELRSLADVEGVAEIQIEPLHPDGSDKSADKIVDKPQAKPDATMPPTAVSRSVTIEAPQPPAPAEAPEIGYLPPRTRVIIRYPQQGLED